MTDEAIALTQPREGTPRQTIRILGRLLDDLERVRIMNGNRIGALRREYGGALPHLERIEKEMLGMEHLAELELVRAFRSDPLAAFGKSIRGLGESSFARLIAELGDPSLGSKGHWENGSGAMPEANAQTANAPEDVDDLDAEGVTVVADTHAGNAPKRRWVVDSYYDRTVSQLWAYCGIGDPARSKIPKGAVQEELLARGKPRLKKQMYLIGTGLLKAGKKGGEAISVWGEMYDAARAHYTERVHNAPCPMCHAKAGDPWRDGHKHMAALRKVEKEFLKELWKEARRQRGLPTRLEEA